MIHDFSFAVCSTLPPNLSDCLFPFSFCANNPAAFVENPFLSSSWCLDILPLVLLSYLCDLADNEACSAVLMMLPFFCSVSFLHRWLHLDSEPPASLCDERPPVLLIPLYTRPIESTP
jgi:hypothetical protein